MKNVLVISLGRTGGLPIYAASILKEMRDVDFNVLVSEGALVDQKLENVISICTYSGKVSFILRTVFYLPFKFILLIPRMYWKYEVLYLPYSHFWLLPFMIFFRLLNRKVVITIHDGILHKGEKNKWLQFNSDLKVRLSTDVIFLTEFVKKQVFDRLQLKKNAYVIPHGIYENTFVKTKEESNSKNILFIGRIGKYKGVELLISAIEEMGTSVDKLIIAGKSLYKLDNRETAENIQIIDKYLSEEEIGTLLGWADILVIPYLEATQSGIITLGIYAELPMVCTNVGGLREQLGDEECVWVEPNKESLKTGLKLLLENESLAANLKAKMQSKKQELSWAKIAKSVVDVFNN